MTLERWQTFSKREQLLFIGSEFERARVSEREGNREYLCGALTRAIALIDITLQDKKWRSEVPMLEGLKDAVQEFITDASRRGVAMLYQIL